ncbi:MAG: ABC transporter ATP-binding protein [Chloroflexota bacterium]
MTNQKLTQRQLEQLIDVTWPITQLGHALSLLAHRTHLSTTATELPELPLALVQEVQEVLDALPENEPGKSSGQILYDHQQSLRQVSTLISPWLEAGVQRLGVEAEPVETTYGDVDDFLRDVGTSLLLLLPPEPSAGLRVLAVVRSDRRLHVLTPKNQIRRLPRALVRTAMCHRYETPLLPGINQMLDTVFEISEKHNDADIEDRRTIAQQTLLKQQLSTLQIGGSWLLRLAPEASFDRHVRHQKLWNPLVNIITLNFLVQGLNLVAWWFVGRGALQGHFQWGWLIAWALVLTTSIPFRLLIVWTQSYFAIDAGALFKQRLIQGTLQLEPEEVKHEGAGRFLGRVIESESVEQLAVNGGLTSLVALSELVIAAFVLSLGSTSWVLPMMLALWTLLFGVMGWFYWRRSRRWVESYREMTNDLVERMVGHRTRLAQEDPAQWHRQEDQLLAQYYTLSNEMDNTALWMTSLIPRGWLLVGLSAVVYTFITTPSALLPLAIMLGGVMLAYQSFSELIVGFQSLLNCGLAWNQVWPLFKSASRTRADEHPVSMDLARPDQATTHNQLMQEPPIIEARDISFHYDRHDRYNTGRIQPVLYNCRLSIRPGERLLLEGPSGSGKSTLASLLVGLRQADSGLLLLNGIDQQTLGLRLWRQRVTSAPQFHENHVFTETFAFNLLMGRQWPPTPEDMAEAERLCVELGLGELLERMPSGLQQMVGESGWQLSHGERSRLFIARALLQKSELIVLDESFAALDPENLQRVLETVFRYAPTLLVIAHP